MDLICFSHIRWDFVYQRPQHLLSRFALYNRVFIIEESLLDGKSNYYDIDEQKEDNLSVVKLYLSRELLPEQKNKTLRALIDSLISAMNMRHYMLWYYTPMALEYSDHLHPKLIVYDCMDELSAFKFAHPDLKKYEALLFEKADLVFTGGILFTKQKNIFIKIFIRSRAVLIKHILLLREIKYRSLLIKKIFRIHDLVFTA